MPESRANYSRRRNRRRRRPQCLPRGLSRGAGVDRGTHGQRRQNPQGRACPIARLTRNEPRLGRELRQFLAQAYDIKSIADYGVGSEIDVPLDRAGAAIDTAEQFVNQVTLLLT